MEYLSVIPYFFIGGFIGLFFAYLLFGYVTFPEFVMYLIGLFME